MHAYPNSPGWKEWDGDTSAAAAVAVAETAESLRDRVLRLLARGPLTADEAAERLGVDRLAIRPRFSELKLLGQVVKTEARRCNVSGKAAVVWRTAGPLGQLELGT